jgi:hypothetical protein
MLGEADQEKGWWEVATFRNRFVNEGGVWKIREMRRFPLMKTDIFLGWGKSRIVDPVTPTASRSTETIAPGLERSSATITVISFVMLAIGSRSCARRASSTSPD